MTTDARTWFPLAILLAAPVQAQIDNSGLLPHMPDDVRAIRQTQVNLAESAGIIVSFHDESMRSATGLRGVPRQFGTVVIADDQDLARIITDLYPFYGFRETETLRFEDKRDIFNEITRYSFRQYINDIQTPQTLTVDVSLATRHIVALLGTLVLDRGFPTASAVTEFAAIQCGLDYVKRSGREAQVQTDGAHAAVIVYRWGNAPVLEPWWQVSLAGVDSTLQFPYFDSYFVSPYGQIISASFSSHGGHADLGRCAE